MLTLLAIPSYKGLLEQQPIGTRISIGQAIVASILKNATRIESALDVNGILELCKDLVMDPELHGRDNASHASSAHLDPIVMAEQQGWLARMIHLFVAKDPSVQFEVSPFEQNLIGFINVDNASYRSVDESRTTTPCARSSTHSLHLPCSDFCLVALSSRQYDIYDNGRPASHSTNI
jgi:hypothetical protein